MSTATLDRYDILCEHAWGGLVPRAHDRELDCDVAINERLRRTHVSEVRFFREAMIPGASSTPASCRSTKPAAGPAVRRSTQ